MKTTTVTRIMQSIILAATLVATASYALAIKGLEKNTEGLYATSAVFNHNVEALNAFPAQDLEKQIAPFVDPGIGRHQVMVVEPVVVNHILDPVASGHALQTALITASTKTYPVLVAVDAGTYTLTEPTITLPANVVLRGSSETSTHINAKSITSGAAAITTISIHADTLTQAQTTHLHNVALTGALIVTGGTFNAHSMSVTTGNTTAITIKTPDAYTLTDVSATSGTKGVDIQSRAKGVLAHNRFTAPIPLYMTADDSALVVDNIYRGGSPIFFSGPDVSKQICHNNINGDTGLLIPRQPLTASSCLESGKTRVMAIRLVKRKEAA